MELNRFEAILNYGNVLDYHSSYNFLKIGLSVYLIQFQNKTLDVLLCYHIPEHTSRRMTTAAMERGSPDKPPPPSTETAPSFPSHLSPPSSLVSAPPHQRWHTAHIRSPHLLPLEPTRSITSLLMSMSCSPALLLPQTHPLGPGSSLGKGWACVCVCPVEAGRKY